MNATRAVTTQKTTVHRWTLKSPSTSHPTKAATQAVGATTRIDDLLTDAA